MRQGSIYTVLTGDLVSSRKVDNRAAVQEKIQTVMNEINREFKSYLVVPFNFTTGDEFQGLMNELKVSFDLAQWWIKELFPYRVRMGIGAGRLFC